MYSFDNHLVYSGFSLTYIYFHRLELRIRLSFKNLSITLPTYINREAAEAV